MKPVCIICHKPPTKQGEFLYERPDGREVWLCGRKACKKEYEG